MVDKLRLSPSNIATVAGVELATAKKLLPANSLLSTLNTDEKLVTERAKQMFKMLMSSGAERNKLLADFFANLTTRLGPALHSAGLNAVGLGFKNDREFANYVMGKLSNIEPSNLARFIKGTRGRKWWFIGQFLWERYIKYGPVRNYLDKYSLGFLEVVNENIRNDPSYIMMDAWERPVKIISEFGSGPNKVLPAGIDFLLDTAEPQQKPYLDFSHIAFNREGYWVIPTPIEIKQLSAARAVAEQFSQFIDRFKKANRLLVTFEEADLPKLMSQRGFNSVSLEKVDGKIIVELDRQKLVFGSRGLKHTVVKPFKDTWINVNPAKKVPTTTVGFGTTKKGKGFNYLEVQIGVSRTPFEKIWEIIFLGTD